jgi:hypothetical protein
MIKCLVFELMLDSELRNQWKFFWQKTLIY